MQTINLDPEDKVSVSVAAQKAALTLNNGGAIAFPTDTVYGLGANALDVAAIDRIYRIKKRESRKPLSIVVKDIQMAKRFAVISETSENFLSRIWPGPVTAILPKRSTLPDSLTDGGPIGIRCIPHPFLQAIFSIIDFPITATSANVSGEVPVSDISELRKQFRSAQLKPDLIIDAGTLPASSASTVIDLCGKEPKILRMGAMSPKKLLQIFDELKT